MSIAPNHLRTVDPDQYDPPTDKDARKAWDELVAIGCPVLGPELQWGGLFAISGECNGDSTHGGDWWADYWGMSSLERYSDPDDKDSHILNAFGINESIHEILRKHGLYTEWINAGVVGVFRL